MHHVNLSLHPAAATRPPGLCNFLEAPELEAFLGPKQRPGVHEVDKEKWRVVYRNYATLYFVFVVDSSESELGILDLIQVRGFLRVPCERRFLDRRLLGLCGISG
jgi:Clathrin adaptor complex small chain